MQSPSWTPPENPDPSEILKSAEDDTRRGQYEQALAKFLWFHDNALQYESGQYGVRLSFALGYWRDLALDYPPARAAFIRTRDETEEAFRRDSSDFHLFHDVASLNDHLGDGIRTADLFEAVAETNQATAQLLYDVAEPYLIAAGRFRACAPFLDPGARLKSAADVYRLYKQLEDSNSDLDPIPIPKLAREHYMRKVATLAGLLVLNDRAADARSVYNESLAILDDEEFRMILDAAMNGQLPEVRPR